MDPESPHSLGFTQFTATTHSHMDSSTPDPAEAEEVGNAKATLKKRKKSGSQRKEKDSYPTKRQVTSSSHFSRFVNNNDQCKYCGKVLKFPTTLNMGKRILLACKQCKALKELEDDTTVTFGRVSEDVFRKACNELLILGKLPLSFIESLAWKHFCSRLNLYKPHSQRTATRDIVQLYANKKAEMKSMLGKQRVSITINIWVAPSTDTSYMMVTAHYIDAMWNLRKLIIGFKNISDRKGSTIALVLLDCLAEWGIEKVFTITVDNATANTSVFEKFKEAFNKVGNNALVLGGEYLHVRCAAHIINLVVKDALHEVDANVTAIRNGVAYVRSSTSRVKSFELQVDSGERTTCSLSLDCKTRWSSTYLMLTRALKFRMAFDKMESEDKLYNEYFEEKVDGIKRVGPPTKDDWEAIERLVRFLRIFYNSTLVVSASNSVSSSKCYGEICTIERNLILISQNHDGEFHSMAKSMREKFDKYWEDLMEINRMLIVASVFDPRYKMKFATFCFEKIYGKDSAECKKLHCSVSEVLKSLLEEYSSVFSKLVTVGTQSQSTDPSSQSEHVSGDDDDNGWYERMDLVYKKMVDDLALQDASNELELYLKEKVENPKSNMPGTDYDVLSWWKLNESKYPILAEIARDVLAMQVSSVASESAFSTSDCILDPYRSCLTHYMIEVLMCTEQWLKCSIHLTEEGAVITNKQLLAEIEIQDSLEKECQSC